MTLQTLERKLKGLQDPLENAVLRWLYLHLPPQVITSKGMHNAYSKAASILMEELEGESLDRSSKTAITKYLQSVAAFIEDYEKKHFAIGAASPEEVLAFLMEQNNVTQYDLAEDLGGQPVVSNVLSGKRKLTREHIERLSKRFHVGPATFYPAYSAA